MKTTVAYNRDTYAERRLIINTVSDVNYKEIKSEEKERECFNLLNPAERQWSSNINASLGYDLIHYFNTINYGDAPWVVTFETSVPRLYTPENYQMGIGVLEKDNCLGIIAMSKAALDIHKDMLMRHAPNSLLTLENKTHVLHPPQVLIPSDKGRFDNIEPLKVIFVSNQFFLKGGLAMLEALIEFRREWQVELTLVTRFGLQDNVTFNNEEDTKEVLRLIKENSSWISYHHGLSNERVINLMKESHLGVMMSFAETYGYVALELQAVGTPVVTTDIRAFPEINSDETGWLVHYPYRNGRLPSGATKEDVVRISNDLKQQFLKVLQQIVADNGKELSRKSCNCQRKIFEENNPYLYQQRLKEIYSSQLK